MKKTIEVMACDICGNDNKGYYVKCQVCGRMHCDECEQDEDWRFIDTCLCNECNDDVWKEFPKLIERMNIFRKIRLE